MEINMDPPAEPPPDEPEPEPPKVVIPEGVPLRGPNFAWGPFALLVTEPHKFAHHIVCPEGGWEFAQQAVDWLMQSGLKERGGKLDLPGSVPWLGMRFEIIALREPNSFLQYCSW